MNENDKKKNRKRKMKDERRERGRNLEQSSRSTETTKTDHVWSIQTVFSHSLSFSIHPSLYLSLSPLLLSVSMVVLWVHLCAAFTLALTVCVVVVYTNTFVDGFLCHLFYFTFIVFCLCVCFVFSRSQFYSIFRQPRIRTGR